MGAKFLLSWCIILFRFVQIRADIIGFNCSELPPPCPAPIKFCPANADYRTFDGSCTNPFKPFWGQVGAKYVYLMSPQYDDGIKSPKISVNHVKLPSPRKIKNVLFEDGEQMSKFWTLSFMIWGQFMAHDISLLRDMDPPPVAPCCTPDGKLSDNPGPRCFNIEVPIDDPKMSLANITCLNFTRMHTDLSLGCFKRIRAPARPVNIVSSPLDLSPLYGNSEEKSNELRLLIKGQLKTDTRNNMTYPPTEFSNTSYCPVHYQTGDARANQNGPLLILHLTLINYHNKMASKLSSINPEWDDEKLYQETRRILIAIFQHICYYEWLPVLMGSDLLVETGIIFPQYAFVDDFDASVNVGATNENSHAASRILHTLIPEHFQKCAENRSILSEIKLSDNFFCQSLLEEPNAVREIARGMVTQPMEEFDTLHVPSITQYLFKKPGDLFGNDLRSIDLQRGRDIGLSSYQDYLKICGIISIESSTGDFDDFIGIISAESIELLKSLYDSAEAVDLSTGMGLEMHIPGSRLGPTSVCLMSDQFLRTRMGDYRWYEHEEAAFTLDQLFSIRNMTFAKLFCEGSSMDNIQPAAFNLVTQNNGDTSCSSLPDIDLELWKDVSGI